jgi:hypothetical protein
MQSGRLKGVHDQPADHASRRLKSALGVSLLAVLGTGAVIILTSWLFREVRHLVHRRRRRRAWRSASRP